MTYKQNNTIITPQTQTLGLHRDSRTITKIQPKIRIIHIYAPEIIKTDVANFRELVQRLTGKPTLADNIGQVKGKGKAKTVKRAPIYGANNNNDNKSSMVNTKLEVMMGSTTTTTCSSSSPSSSCDHYTNNNDENDHGYWKNDTTIDNNNNNINSNTSGGFLSAFTDMDDHFDLSMFTLGGHEVHSFGEASQLSFRG